MSVKEMAQVAGVGILLYGGFWFYWNMVCYVFPDWP